MSTTFADLGVPASLQRGLAARGIVTPFPIQSATIADALAGRDVLGRAPTGSGKTLAFGIPLTVGLERAQPRRPRALVLAPTRELAQQIGDELSLLATDARVVTVYGGVGYGPQTKALSRGVEIVVACPGRLEDLLARGALQLGDVQRVVIDEADRLADMGFLPAVRRLLDATPAGRQVLLFSATLGGPVAGLTSAYQRNPVRHEVEGVDQAAMARHVLLQGARDRRIAATADLVREHGSTLVFCRTRRGADRVAQHLERQGVSAAAIHGGRNQAQRDRALARFTRGQVDVLVATDVAARGIHVDDIACVVHYDPAADADTYVHRSGRTARAGATGLVVTLAEGADARAVAKTVRAAGIELETMDVAPTTARPTRSAPAPRSARALRPAAGKPAPRDGRGESTGTVKFFDQRRGFGFIELNGRSDLFVHHSQFTRKPVSDLRGGELVRFEIAPGRNGDEARNVRIA